MKLTVIVPTLDEAKYIEACLQSIRREFLGEVLLVDGGSEDATSEKAESLATKVLTAPAGLARQCNLGAVHASGDTLLFVAADCQLPFGWLNALEETLVSPYVLGGGFKLAIDASHWAYQVITAGGNFRSRYHKMALPDQGLFVRRSNFVALGGMDPRSQIPFARLCEQINLQGEFKLLPLEVHSSPRKWEEGGKLATTWQHMKTYFQYLSS